MRKIVCGSLFLALVGMGTMGCKKEITPNEKVTSITNEISKSDDVLRFVTIKSFEDFVSNGDEDLRATTLESIKSAKFKNYFTGKNNEFVVKSGESNEMDDFLGQLLNKDGAIVIGEYLFKIDLANEKVYAVKYNKNDVYSIAIAKINRVDKDVTVFSTDDDVLFAIENEFIEKCGGIGGGTYPCYANNYQGQIVATLGDGSVWRLNAGVKHFRAGVYFRLSSLYEVWAFPNASSTSGIKVNNLSGLFTVEVFCKHPQGWYKKRPCGSGDIGTQSGGFYYSNTQASYQKTFYDGIRNLNGYHFFVQARAKYPNGSVTIASPYGGRNINSPY